MRAAYHVQRPVNIAEAHCTAQRGGGVPCLPVLEAVLQDPDLQSS